MQDIIVKKHTAQNLPTLSVPRDESEKTSKYFSIQKEKPIVENNVEFESRPIIEKSDFQRPRSSYLKFFLYILAIAIFIGGLYFLSLYFAQVKVYVKAKQQNFVLTDESFSATRSKNAGINFEIMIVEGEEKKDLIFTEQKELASKAKGVVVLYNEFSNKPQKLLINTKLVDSDKRIYLTDKVVSIPGYTTKGTKIIPGSVEVEVTASSIGSAYNGDPRDFSILAFLKTPKEKKIYARSKGPLSGGGSGNVFVPSAEQKGIISSSVSNDLRSKLEKKLIAQIPPEYIAYPGSMQFHLSLNTDDIQSPTQEASVVGKGSMVTVLLKEKDLERAIIKSVYPAVTSTEISQITVPQIKDLTLKLDANILKLDKNTSSLSFTLKGDGHLLWHPNLEVLQKQIVGISKSNLDAVFAQNVGIASARTVFRPPWKKTTPTEISKIKIFQE